MGETWRYFRLNGPPSFTDSKVFTVKIHHGGRLFSNNGENRRYLGGEVCFVDGVDRDKLSWTLFNCWAYDLGYEGGITNYFYKIPSTGALIHIISDGEAYGMGSQVDDNGEVEVFIVCNGQRRILDEDELGIFNEGINHMDFMGHTIADIEVGDEEVGIEDCDETGKISSDGEDSDYLNECRGSDSEENDASELKGRVFDGREFRQQDLKKPEFELGMAFASSKTFKHAVKKYAVLTQKEIRFSRNTKTMVQAVCKGDSNCPFKIYASSHKNDPDTLFIKTYQSEHSCSSVGGKVYHCTAPFIAGEYYDQFRNDPKWSRKGIQSIVNKELKQVIGFQTAYRARKYAARMSEGSTAQQYNMLGSYCIELRKRNPGSSAHLKTSYEDGRVLFEGIYICLKGLADGWKHGCRPIVCLDGCHLKGTHRGILLAAVGIDGNNGMYPLAWAVVQSECKQSWSWFLDYLTHDLNLDPYDSKLEFMSDKQKGLEQCILDMFPGANHRHCVRHLHNNFKLDGFGGLELKQMVWDAARSTTKGWWEKNMKRILNKSPKAYEWLKLRAPNHWSLAYFRNTTKCDMLLNNLCESFNSTILAAREKTILPLLEDIRSAVMVRLSTRRKSGGKWKGNVAPRIERILKKNANRASGYMAFESSQMRFEVRGKGPSSELGIVSQHAILLDKKSCSCGKYDISGIPCEHAIASILAKGHRPDDYCSYWFSKEQYMKTYNVCIEPITGQDEWEVVDRPIEPPSYKRQPGRPKKLSRAMEPGEVPGRRMKVNSRGVKLPKALYTASSCSVCKEVGHNMRSCQKRPKDLAIVAGPAWTQKRKRTPRHSTPTVAGPV